MRTTFKAVFVSLRQSLALQTAVVFAQNTPEELSKESEEFRLS